MNKTICLFVVFILSAAFLFSCSSQECDCHESEISSSSLTPSSSSNGNSVQNQDLIRKNITLSSEKSYADIQGEPTAYTEDAAASKLDKIDLVAYCNANMGCKNNSIYNPWEIKLFFDNSGYLGKYIYLFSISNEQAVIFKTAEKLYDILPTYNNLIKTFNDDNSVDEIPIEEGKVFFVVTSENNNGIVIGIVIIKQVGEQSIDLEIIDMEWSR